MAVALARPVIDAAGGQESQLATGGGELLPEITEHRESYEQGGAKYWRCEGCGRETIYGRDRIPHAEGCPRREGD